MRKQKKKRVLRERSVRGEVLCLSEKFLLVFVLKRRHVSSLHTVTASATKPFQRKERSANSQQKACRAVKFHYSEEVWWQSPEGKALSRGVPPQRERAERRRYRRRQRFFQERESTGDRRACAGPSRACGITHFIYLFRLFFILCLFCFSVLLLYILYSAGLLHMPDIAYKKSYAPAIASNESPHGSTGHEGGWERPSPHERAGLPSRRDTQRTREYTDTPEYIMSSPLLILSELSSDRIIFSYFLQDIFTSVFLFFFIFSHFSFFLSVYIFLLSFPF